MQLALITRSAVCVVWNNYYYTNCSQKLSKSVINENVLLSEVSVVGTEKTLRIKSKRNFSTDKQYNQHIKTIIPREKVEINETWFKHENLSRYTISAVQELVRKLSCERFVISAFLHQKVFTGFIVTRRTRSRRGWLWKNIMLYHARDSMYFNMSVSVYIDSTRFPTTLLCRLCVDALPRVFSSQISVNFLPLSWERVNFRKCSLSLQ